MQDAAGAAPCVRSCEQYGAWNETKSIWTLTEAMMPPVPRSSTLALEKSSSRQCPIPTTPFHWNSALWSSGRMEPGEAIAWQRMGEDTDRGDTMTVGRSVG
jgi:hypothetical protein